MTIYDLADPFEMLDLLGFPLLLVKDVETKAPLQKGWPAHVLTGDEVREHQPSGAGLAVKLGGEACFIDIEGDGPAAEKSWQLLSSDLDLPQTVSWRSERGRHRLFLLPDGLRQIVGDGVIKVGDLEVRLGTADRYTHYSIIPPFGMREWVDDPLTGAPVAELPLAIAQRLQAYKQERLPEIDPTSYPEPDKSTPGYVYGEQVEWDEILPADGWTKLSERIDGVTDWCRPGKSLGLSATTGFCGDRMYVFTTSVPPLESGASYSKFQYLAHTKFKSNFSACASNLASQGYVPTSADVFDDLPDFDGMQADGEIPLEDEDEANNLSVDTDDLLFPGFVRNFAEYHAKRSYSHDLRTSAVVGIVFQSWLMGRKVKLYDGTRPNVAAMLLAPSSSGKSEAVGTMKDLLRSVGKEEALYERFKSWQALEDAIGVTPNMIYVKEEVQDLLRAITDTRADANTAGQATVIKELITSSKQSYRTRMGVGATGQVATTGSTIDQPNLSLLFTGLASEVWGTMTQRLLRDGFVGRLWPIECNEFPARNDKPYEDKELFEVCKEHAIAWLRNVPEQQDPLETLSAVSVSRLIPKMIDGTPTAKAKSLAFAHYCDKKRANGDAALSSVWGRAHELMCTLQLLIAGSRSVSNCLVVDADVELAISLVEKSIEQKIYRMETRHEYIETEYTRAQNAIVRFMQRKSSKDKTKFSRTEIYQGAHITSRDLLLALPELMNRRFILTDATLSQDGGRVVTPGTYLQLPKYAKAKA